MRSISLAQAKVEENLEKAPLKLAEMLEEGVGFLKKKYASESAELGDELTSLEKLMDSFINQREEELQGQRDLFDNLMEKHKKLLQYLMDFSRKSEETQKMLTELESKLASKEKVKESKKSKKRKTKLPLVVVEDDFESEVIFNPRSSCPACQEGRKGEGGNDCWPCRLTRLQNIQEEKMKSLN